MGNCVGSSSTVRYKEIYFVMKEKNTSLSMAGLVFHYLEESKMTQEEMTKVMEQPEMKEAIFTFFMGYLQQEKKNKVRNYHYRNQYAKKGQILFVGSSLMEGFPVNELMQTSDIPHIIYNRGIGGYVTTDLLANMETCIFELEPSKIFINIGTNDIGSPDYKKENLIANYENILTQITERLPYCKVYVMAYYPINAKANFPGIEKMQKEEMFKIRTNPNILVANAAVEELTTKLHHEFINVNEGLMDDEGNLKEEYAIEGLHMWPGGYAIVLGNLMKYL